MRNILVIKLRYIGDVLLATPALRALRERFPGARLTMAVNRGTEDILKRNPTLNGVLIVDRDGFGCQTRFLRELRRRRFDTVIDLTDGDRSAIMTRVTGARLRIGFNEEHRWRGLLYTHLVRADRVMHRVERDMEAVRPLGIEAKAGNPELHVSSEDEEAAAQLLEELGIGRSSLAGPMVMLQPGARYWFKAWPPERFAELADRLTETCGCRVLVGGDANDKPVAEAIRARARSAPTVLAGRTTLLQLAALLKRSALFVGNDNGPMHMAAALGVPVIGLFGPSDPAVWGPWGQGHRILYQGLDCRACFHPDCFRGEQNCMRLITVDEAWAAAQELLRR
jgi:heptosyltransferase-3